ncbi:Ras family GTPase, putative [Entamoeba histolytica HM-3:IMSS]|uniref:Ras family GTPase, putative n=1 Tax=Entamoeba histolytica HM-3:IMSS TaxID=885315 RepID=M7X0D8_ENTHI|nr:Ras family GTPase, putative [Entamoeba histolytica HM-3:IMSS]
MSQSYHFKIVLLGPAFVGKSAIAFRFTKNTFISGYEPTIEQTFNKTIEFDGKQVRLDVYDTAGSEQFRTLLELYIKEGDGFILVYAVDDNASFNGIKCIYNDIVNITTSMNDGVVPLTLPPILIAGNKCDLDDKVVKNEEVQEFCNTHGCDFLETSAKRNENIDQIFALLARRLVEQQGNLQKKNNCPMQRNLERWPQNVAGPYYVDKKCIDCGNCRRHAPNNFGRINSEIHSYVKKQPTTPEEIESCNKAILCCPVHAIHKQE